MAKCLICNAQKGKRLCILKEGLVCSLCCGTTRTLDTCGGCPHYQDPKLTRNYRQVPAFTPQMMNRDEDLNAISRVVESAICAFDRSAHELSDPIALRIIELLIDKYHFMDPPTTFDSALLENGFRLVEQLIAEDMAEDVSDETVTKVLGVIYRVATRRSSGKREYLDFIQKFVGFRIAPGVRVMQIQSGD